MRILDRYIAGRLVKGYGTVMLFLLSMFSFLALIQELDQVGKGSYRVVDALQYIAFHCCPVNQNRKGLNLS
jgi:lipopolysaccharide export system permease protein